MFRVGTAAPAAACRHTAPVTPRLALAGIVIEQGTALLQGRKALANATLDKIQPLQGEDTATLAMQIIFNIQHLGTKILHLEQAAQCGSLVGAACHC